MRQDLASTFQGHLVEKKYLRSFFFFLNLIILNVDKACRQCADESAAMKAEKVTLLGGFCYLNGHCISINVNEFLKR